MMCFRRAFSSGSVIIFCSILGLSSTQPLVLDMFPVNDHQNHHSGGNVAMNRIIITYKHPCPGQDLNLEDRYHTVMVILSMAALNKNNLFSPYDCHVFALSPNNNYLI
jgi:hypothetical protein